MGSRWSFRRTDNLTLFICRLSRNSRVSKLLGPEGLVLACNGAALPSVDVDISLAKIHRYLTDYNLCRCTIVLCTSSDYRSFYSNKIQRDSTVCRCLFTAKLLYMFRACIVPIIRSTSNCNCSFCYRSYHV